MHTVKEPGRVASGVLAFTVHLLFFGFLIFGISWQKKVNLPVEVEIWQDLTPAPQKEPVPEPPPPPKPVPEVKKEPLPPPPPPQVVKEPPPA
ncbi:MAG TPA: protein TolA, partial [Burkholderiales bacterium]|nr:protein TolA [Burkholderiales bacterium]